MKFAALAKEVSTTAPTGLTHAVANLKMAAVREDRKYNGKEQSHRRKVTLSTDGGQAHETLVEVLEGEPFIFLPCPSDIHATTEDEEPRDEDDEEDEPINPLVDTLFDEIEALRAQLFEAEMRCAIIEADTREEVMQEMEERMRTMEKTFNRRLMKEVR